MNIDKLLAGLPTKTTSELKAMRINAESWQASGTPAQQAAAQQLLTAMAEQGAAETSARVVRLDGAGLATRVAAAFTAHPPTDTEERIVRVLLDNPGSTSRQLSAAIGWKAQTWQMHFGTMCGNRSDYLWSTPIPAKRSATFLSGVLVDYDGPSGRFTMKPESVAGFAELGITPKPGTRNADL